MTRVNICIDCGHFSYQKFLTLKYGPGCSFENASPGSGFRKPSPRYSVELCSVEQFDFVLTFYVLTQKLPSMDRFS